MNNILASIVGPTYNSERFLEQTLKSLINQDYSNIEILVIDGGSKDGTINIIKKYENHIAYWISEKDSGQSNALNKGFKAARGVIAGWLCSDDILYPDSVRIAAQEFMKDDNIGIVYGDIDQINSNNKIFRKIKYGPLSADYILNTHHPVPQQGSFYRLKLLEKVGYLDESLHQVMDYDLFIKLLKISQGKYVDRPLGQFRMFETNKSTIQGAWVGSIEGFRVTRRHGGKIFSQVTFLRLKRMSRYLIKRLLGIKLHKEQ
ncbi:MAG: glycosyltransferase [Ignavibacteriales bacterium]|nr:glycosyltransferase [Ignavibacteriales bacterium]